VTAGFPSRPWTLRRRIAKAFVVITAVLVLLVAAVVLATVEFVGAGNDVVYKWDRAVTATQRLLTDLVDQETGIRGYALSGNPDFVRPYRQYRSEAKRDGARVANLVGGDKQLERALADLDRAVATWQRDVAAPVIAGLRAGDPAARRIVEGQRAKQLFDAIRARTDTLSTAVEARTAKARGTRRDAGILFVVAMSLAAAVLAIVGVGVWRGLHRWVLAPADRLRAQTRLVASGDTYREIVPDGPVEFTALGLDVEAMRLQIAGQLARAEQIHEELRLRGEELTRSNEDLQQFAYVASHDLSEPLRKVANFCQLLERQYGPQLDDRARQYIDFAVDGAKRMQVLISDLLALSRVGRTTAEFVPVDLDAALDAACATLTDKITAAGAKVERTGPLPTVAGDPALLTSLFENLVGNAVKYRREDVAPVVRVEASDDGEMWTFTVADNGIGIDPQYAERIFVVFQRLHLRDSYGGTGIGLALCRKIVEFHGGRIWLDGDIESSPGATFRFTIPKGGVVAESRD
jgi:signal transduction histidine kinase